jgi:serine/threonine protein kinase
MTEDYTDGDETLETIAQINGQAFDVLSEYKNDYYINPQEAYLLIGSGSYGKVYSTCKLAVKVMRFVESDFSEDIYLSPEKALKELYMMTLIGKHKNIISLISFTQLDEEVHIYMDLAKTDLAHLLLNSGEGSYDDWQSIYIDNDVSSIHTSLSEESIRKYTRDLIRCVEYVHSLEILHGDIKPLNLLIKENGTLALADFGDSFVLVDGKHRRGNIISTERYQDIEMLSAVIWRNYTKACDWWSVACVIVEMVTGIPMIVAERNAFSKDSYTPLIKQIKSILYVENPLTVIEDIHLRQTVLRFFRLI